jgi:hypothetical protein
MPHVIVEYSANLADHLDAGRLVNDPHQAPIDSGVTELVGILRAPRAHFPAPRRNPAGLDPRAQLFLINAET